jgi:hypothetical protein
MRSARLSIEAMWITASELARGLVIASQAAAPHKPAETAFYYPASFYDLEAAGVGVSVDDFYVDSEAGAVFDGGVLESGVDPGLGYGRVGVQSVLGAISLVGDEVGHVDLYRLPT